MTANQLDQIESQLNLLLPTGYRNAALAGSLLDPLHNDPGALIHINNSFRSGEFGDVAWPTHYFAFGHDGGSNYYVLDTTSNSAPVYIRDHETTEVSFVAHSFDQWIAEFN